eukprot:gene6335-14364_t
MASGVIPRVPSYPPPLRIAPSRTKGYSDDWFFFMEGGGACKAYEDCRARAGSSLGSSTFWPPTGGGGTPPPGFNFVKIKYCSGDSHMGRQPLYAPWNMSFCGHLIVAEIIGPSAAGSLRQTHGLGAAGGRVVVSGSSAGGHGTYINADYFQRKRGRGKMGALVADTLPEARVFAYPFAGFFYPSPLWWSRVEPLPTAPQGGGGYPNVTDFGTWRGLSAADREGSGYATNLSFWGAKPQEAVWNSFKPKECVARHPAADPMNVLCSNAGACA